MGREDKIRARVLDSGLKGLQGTGTQWRVPVCSGPSDAERDFLGFDFGASGGFRSSRCRRVPFRLLREPSLP